MLQFQTRFLGNYRPTSLFSQDGFVELRQKMDDAPSCYGWRKTFVIIPRQTISNKWFCLGYLYKRKVRYCYSRAYYQDIIEFATTMDLLTYT